AQVVLDERKCRVVAKLLLRRAIDVNEACAQYVMPRQHPFERGEQRRTVERTAEPQRRRHMIGSAGSMVELIDEPQPLLRKRQRRRRGTFGTRRDARDGDVECIVRGQESDQRVLVLTDQLDGRCVDRRAVRAGLQSAVVDIGKDPLPVQMSNQLRYAHAHHSSSTCSVFSRTCAWFRRRTCCSSISVAMLRMSDVSNSILIGNSTSSWRCTA